MTRRILPACALGALLFTFSAALLAEDAVRLSEPVAVTDTHEIFGAPMPSGGDYMSLSQLIGDSEQYDGQQVQVETRIAKVCQKKGCFFIATEGASSARISFQDYGFFIPTDSGGKTVTLVGTFSRSEVSQEQADHFAEDLGEGGKADPAAFEYSIVATAVQIPRG